MALLLADETGFTVRDSMSARASTSRMFFKVEYKGQRSVCVSWNLSALCLTHSLSPCNQVALIFIEYRLVDEQDTVGHLRMACTARGRPLSSPSPLYLHEP